MPEPGWWLRVGGIALLAAALRLLVFEAARPVATTGDETYYVEVADHLARGRGHLYVGEAEGESRAWRPPAHPWLLSRFLDPGRPERTDPAAEPRAVARLQRVQIALGVLLVALTAVLGRALFDARTGLLAAGLAAIDPALVAQSHMLWSETLFSALVTAGLAVAAGAAAGPGAAAVLAGGLAFGAASLTREAGWLVAAACALWWTRVAAPGERRRAFAHGAALAALAAACALPWAVRNHALFGRWIGVSTVGWFAVAEGNTLERPNWRAATGPRQARFHADYFSTRDELARLDLARRRALAEIAAEQPWWAAKKLVRNLRLLLGTDSVLALKLRRGAYGDSPAPVLRWLLAASGPAWVLLALAAALGVALSDARRRSLALLVLSAVMLVHVVANATPRFRVPWLPLLCVYAAHALSRGTSRRWRRTPVRS
jgi:hypothetical protein